MDEVRLDAVFECLTAEEGRPTLSPFRWQRRLLRRFVGADLPAAVDVPTGLGKTSVMALWLIALGEGACLPRRLVYVVDRRAVVDQATRFAERLRSNLPADLAERLELGQRDGKPRLPISTLRGGFVDNRDWLDDPSRPALLVGTVDLIGSRLLFEGYGVSKRRGMRPFQAGLLGVDTLVLLDEAHLCAPFERLLRQIEVRQHSAFGPSDEAAAISAPPFHLMSLSATGRTTVEAHTVDIFRLEEEDRQEPIVRQRLTARKRMKVIELDDQNELPVRLAERAVELGRQRSPSARQRELLPLFDSSESNDPARVLVHCHRRADAIKVKALIDKACGLTGRTSRNADGKGASELLVGERRVYERRALEQWLERHGFLSGTESAPVAPTFLVATSAGEVGVDLDADHMICDLVAYERMVQRLGRVNRRGGDGREALIDVLAPRPQPPKSNASKTVKARYESDCAVFKARIKALRTLPLGSDGRYDASPDAAGHAKTEHPAIIDQATTPPPLHPALTRPLVDAWSMTSLKRHEGRPEVGPWLRGWEEQEEPQTTVLWRTHVPRTRAGDGTITAPRTLVDNFFQCAAPHATEKLEALRSHVLDWLLARSEAVGKRPREHELAIDEADIVAVVLDSGGDCACAVSLTDLRFLARKGTALKRAEKRDQRQRRAALERVLAENLVVVDARIGGLSANGMLDEKCDLVAVTADADEQWRELREDPDSDTSRPVVGFCVRRVTAGAGDEGLGQPPAPDGWRHVRTFETEFDAGGGVRAGLDVFKWRHDAANDGARSILSVPQPLRSHADQVAARVRGIAKRLRLPVDEIDALVIAARLHDEGKAAERWQRAMNAPPDGRPYAKTRGGGDWRLLEGYSHEFGSLIAAETAELPEATRDLILHLIAAHHGHGRPLIPFAGCEDAPPSRLEATAREAALRFARLQKSYGPWGLAWREAILRAADQGASREWSEKTAGTGGR